MSKDEHDVNLKHYLRHAENETLTIKIHQFLTSKHLSQDKLCVLQMIKTLHECQKW